MSLFHFSVHLDGRSKTGKKNKSCVRKIAYNCCADFSKFSDVNQVNFEEKSGFVESFFLMPVDIKKSFLAYLKTQEKEIYEEIKNIDKNEPNKFKAEQEINKLKALVFAKAVEQVEKRVDSQFTREITVALQHELLILENKAILERFIQEQYLSKGMLANVAIHDSRSDLGGGGLHAHISLSLRNVNSVEEVMKTGKLFGKKNRDWNDLENVEKWRKAWAEINNEMLEKYYNKKISHLSYERQAKQALKENDFREYERLQKLAENVLPHIPKAEMRTRSQKQAYYEKRKHHSEIIKTINKTFMELYGNAHRFIKTFTAKIHSNANNRNRLRNRDLLRNQLTNPTRINEERKDIGNAMQREPNDSSIRALPRM